MRQTVLHCENEHPFEARIQSFVDRSTGLTQRDRQRSLLGQGPCKEGYPPSMVQNQNVSTCPIGRVYGMQLLASKKTVRESSPAWQGGAIKRSMKNMGSARKIDKIVLFKVRLPVSCDSFYTGSTSTRLQ